MPKKSTPKETAVPSQGAAAPARAVKSKTTVEVTSAPRVTSVKHSKAAPPVVVELVASNPHDQIAKIAYGYWEARGFQPGSPEQDWLRAEREYLLGA